MSRQTTALHFNRGVTEMNNKIYTHLCRNYHTYSFIANLLNAVSMAGLALLGVLTDTLAVAWLVGWGFMFAIMFGIGKLLDQEIDDLDKVKQHSHCAEDVADESATISN